MIIKDVFEKTGFNSIELEIFLSSLLGKDRSFIKAFPDFPLNQTKIAKVKDFYRRRTKGEPLAYILGYQDFYHFRLKVDKRVLIPRPETEELVTEVIKHAFSVKIRPLSIADIGTGSGNIAISLAKAIPFAKVYAIDKSRKALEVAQDNIAGHRLQDRVRLLQGNLVSPLKTKMDIIVANLPYIPNHRIDKLQPEVRWEPKVALDGGNDGMGLYRKLFKDAENNLKKGGYLFYELDGRVYLRSY